MTTTPNPNPALATAQPSTPAQARLAGSWTRVARAHGKLDEQALRFMARLAQHNRMHRPPC